MFTIAYVKMFEEDGGIQLVFADSWSELFKVLCDIAETEAPETDSIDLLFDAITENALGDTIAYLTVARNKQIIYTSGF